MILCRSADRRNKEQAMHNKFSQRIEEALERLARRIARSKKRLDPAAVNRQIGCILQQNQRAAARFAVASLRRPDPSSYAERGIAESLRGSRGCLLQRLNRRQRLTMDLCLKSPQPLID